MSDTNETSTGARESGLEALRTRRYQDAVAHLTRHCEREPDDVEALMELGLAELLLGQRTRFAGRYATLARRFSVTSPTTDRARALWERCRRIGESMAAAAVLLTAAGIPATSAGCAKTSSPEPTPAAVQVPVSSATTAPTVGEPEPTEEVVEVPQPDAAPGPAASATPAPSPTPTRDYPKTRYVAVRPDPVPNLVP